MYSLESLLCDKNERDLDRFSVGWLLRRREKMTLVVSPDWSCSHKGSPCCTRAFVKYLIADSGTRRRQARELGRGHRRDTRVLKRGQKRRSHEFEIEPRNLYPTHLTNKQSKVSACVLARNFVVLQGVMCNILQINSRHTNCQASFWGPVE